MLSYSGDMTNHVRPVPVGVSDSCNEFASPSPANSYIRSEAAKFVRSFGYPLNNTFAGNDQRIAPGSATTTVFTHWISKPLVEDLRCGAPK